MQILHKTKFRSFSTVLGKNPDSIIDIITKSGLKKNNSSILTGNKLKKAKNAYFNSSIVAYSNEHNSKRFKENFILNNNPDNVIEGLAIISHLLNVKNPQFLIDKNHKTVVNKIKKSIRKSKWHTRKTNTNINLVHSMKEIDIPNNSHEVYFNVETLANIPLILKESWNNNYLVSIFGDISKPGVYEISKNSTVRELIAHGEPYKEIKALKLEPSFIIPYNPDQKLSELEHVHHIKLLCHDRSIPYECRKDILSTLEKTQSKYSDSLTYNYRMLELVENILNNNNKENHYTELYHHLESPIKLNQIQTDLKNRINSALFYFPKEFKN